MKSRTLLTVAAIVAILFAAPYAQAQDSIVGTAVKAGKFNTLIAAAKAAGLAGTLESGTFTVFAPTDEAFANLPAGTVETLLLPENRDQLAAILTYHVVPGRVRAADAFDLNSAPTVNGQRAPLNFKSVPLQVGSASVVATDIECSNGIIHIIDEVMLPADKNIVETAQSTGTFNTLLAAAGAAGLGGALSGNDPLTVFAPTDEAFAKLPAGTVESLLEPANKQKLVDILKYHVVSGRVYASDALKAKSASTLLGRSIRANLDAQGVAINDARVQAANIDASNGVVHVIDTVLIPQSMTPTATLSLLQDAIGRGAPIYNSGDHQACCDIYMQTLTSLRDSGIDGAPQHVMTQINDTLTNAHATSHATNRAWALRSCMDSVYQQVSSMSSMPATFTGGR